MSMKDIFIAILKSYIYGQEDTGMSYIRLDVMVSSQFEEPKKRTTLNKHRYYMCKKSYIDYQFYNPPN